MLGKIIKENDFIICLALSHSPLKDYDGQKQIMIQNSSLLLDCDKDKSPASDTLPYPSLTSLSWCAYKISQNKVTVEETINIDSNLS